ncbi:ATPase [bacterium M00.F.Ca.ET.159.01.1.1]|nr:ATPase [bacterium M00.F.Ca.ET.159.01.1.1]TGT85045.1 ATPase [bacterium M00.F.Ca.ET.157.01.1.1]
MRAGAWTSNGRRRANGRVIVCGNEKGGSGKTTTAMHIAIALIDSGHKVATVDLDERQLSLTRYVDNRRRWARFKGITLPVPHHFHVSPVGRAEAADVNSVLIRELKEGLASIAASHDFVVIDTPGANTVPSRVAHRMADTLISPMNDSFLDFDVLARVDPLSHEILGYSQYALVVLDARRSRLLSEDASLDWVVVRNRMSTLASRNERKIDSSLRQLSADLGFRVTAGISERVAFREFFTIGVTALDDFENQVLRTEPTMSHLMARQEIRALLKALHFPLDESNRMKGDARRRQAASVSCPIALPDILAKC